MSSQIIIPNELLSRHTTWRVGGPAEYLCQPQTKETLIQALKQCEEGVPITWLGLGSNVLVRDGGLPGLTVLTHHALNDIEQESETLVAVGAGTACPKAAKWTAKQGLSGAEFLSGIPGTIGGALFMNAGAFGGEIWPIVHSVEIMHRTGEVERLSHQAFGWAYRSLIKKPEGEYWFTRAWLKLSRLDSKLAQEKVKGFIAQRNQSQPVGLANCGSVFKNPEGDYAARLIDNAGLKGLKMGDAQVSPKHANFIINLGDATAFDIEQLMQKVQALVYENTGTHLEPEVRMMGKSRDE